MYKFEFKIRNAETNEIIVSDWTLFDGDDIREFGIVETVDIHTGAALRHLKRVIAREAPAQRLTNA